MMYATLFYVVQKNFMNRKSRVFFTILGVAVAIAVVLSLVSFGYGLQQSLLDRITTEEALLSLDIIPSDPVVIKFDTQMLAAVQNIPNVESVSPQAELPGQMAWNGDVAEAGINAVDSEFLTLDGRSPAAGRFFGPNEGRKVVVNATVAELFGVPNDELVGRALRLTVFVPRISEEESGAVRASNGLVEAIELGEYEIVGVTDVASQAGGIYIDRATLPEGTVTQYAFAKVKVRDGEQLQSTADELINRGFIVSSLSDTVAQANKIFSAIQLVLGIFGTFALIVAGIGLVNTMTISLLERTNEIGIMRAVGAAPKDIRRIFLGEAILIGFIGGLSGVILGLFISELLGWLFNLLAASLGGESVRLFVYPLWFIAFIMILSTAVGFLGGLWPARRAGKMNPLQALRYK